jgi:type VI secretion system protein ImpB
MVEQIPEMKQLMELRSALTSLKGPLGNVPAFRKKIQALLQDQTSRTRLLDELGIAEQGG